jgi:ribosomal protein L11 methyltransferase
MAWLSLSVEVDEAHANALSDAFIDAGATAVSLEDAEAGSAGEAPLFAEPGEDTGCAWRRNRLVVLAAANIDPASLAATACAAAGIALPHYALSVVADQDWVRATQAQFEPLRVGDHLWIVPSWHEPPQSASAVIVRLDPGLAFGTGSHATTRLVLAWLERNGCVGKRVLDYGCGSGILAIAAARLGALDADGVDIDSQAIESAAANAGRNGVKVRAWTPDTLPPGDYDCVLANILANPLIVLAPLLASRTRRGGSIALCGILDAQADDVIAAYAGNFDIAIAGEEEGWVLIAGTRR